MKLKSIGIGLVATIASLSLAACGGGGSGLSAATPAHSAQQSASKATGTIKFTLPKPKIAATKGRKPSYISPTFTHATLWIDAAATLTSPTAFGGTCATAVDTVTTCTITFTIGPTGTPQAFGVEIDDGLHVLAEGTKTYTLVPGDNSDALATPITLNGVASKVAFDTSLLTVTVEDAGGNPIVTPGTFDNGPITVTSGNPADGTVATTPSPLAVPASTTGRFVVTCEPSNDGLAFTLIASEPSTPPSPSIPLSLTSGLTPALSYGPTVPPALDDDTLPPSVTCAANGTVTIQ
jgi:hypothetical protein